MPIQRDWLDYVDVFGGLIVAVVTFFLGFILARYIEKKKTLEEQREMRKYFQEYWIEQLFSAKSMLENLSSFCTLIEKDSEFESSVLVRQVQPFFMYDTMDKQKLFNSFLAIGKKEFLIEAMKFIELIRTSDSLIYMTHYKSYTEINRENRERWNSAIKEFRAVQLLVEVEITKCVVEKANPSSVVSQINSYYKIKPTTSSEWIRQIVNPLRALLRDLYDTETDNPITSRLFSALEDYKRAFDDNLTCNKMTAYLFREQIKLLEEEMARIRKLGQKNS